LKPETLTIRDVHRSQWIKSKFLDALDRKKETNMTPKLTGVAKGVILRLAIDNGGLREGLKSGFAEVTKVPMLGSR
jgi:hypothetical protein